ncbi:MAG: hypothetical protein H6810_07400 [Phycisphaeraceae bacterium]|nr:MAG: hypothetical protein H6810_07400 [Phycisphaeraceae bacterium]
MKKSLSIHLAAGLVASAAGLASAQTVTVTTASNAVDIDFFTGVISDLPGPDGLVSFAEAMIATNNTPGHQTIEFAIPQADWPMQWLWPGRAVIQGGNLRAFDEVTIDGSSQTAFTGDTNPDGAEVAVFGAEIYLNAGHSTLIGFDNTSINASGPDNVIQGCTGTTNISLFDATNNLIGGTEPGQGNKGGTIKVDRSNNNIVVGNTVQRVRIQGFVSDFGTGPAIDNRVGGPTTAERNFITGYGTHSGEGYPGGTTVELFDSEGTIVENNWIGTTPDGMSSGSDASTQGIGFYGVNTGTIIRNNRIAGILGIGIGPHAQGLLFGQAIYLNGTGGDITITGNTIGLNANDEPVLGSVFGVYGENYLNNPLTNVTIGGISPGDGNVIAGHLLYGIILESPMQGIEISGNSIYGNNDLGIDLGNNGVTWFGVTPNDPLDADAGANGLQNYPVIDTATTSLGGTHVTGQLPSAPNSAYRVELFASPACDESGHGEGELFLGHFFVATDPLGVAPIDDTVAGVVPTDWVVTATATDIATGNTSEFSACVVATGGSCPVDFNGDGVLDLTDIGAFITGFSSHDPAVDLNGDGVFDLADVQLFIASFTAGCP